MEIAVLSGKGGTGKTTISANLAVLLDVHYIDCDVEEPNGQIFLKPSIHKSYEVGIPVPQMDKSKCIACGRCVEVCQFNALANTLSGILVFDDLCHGCGACSLVCPVGAVEEVQKNIGIISEGVFQTNVFMEGKLNIKEPMAGPIITELKASAKKIGDRIVDCAPGTSCNVIKGLEGADYALLVTEPTKFGLHDLRLAVQLVRDMKIPFGIVLNRSDDNSGIIKSYCSENQIELLGEIPFSRRAAKAYSKGNLLIDEPDLIPPFNEMAANVKEALNKVRKEALEAGDLCK